MFCSKPPVKFSNIINSKSFALDIQIGTYNNSCLQTQFYCPLLPTLHNYGLLWGTLSSLCTHLSKTQPLNWLNCFSQPHLKNILFDYLHNRKSYFHCMTGNDNWNCINSFMHIWKEVNCSEENNHFYFFSSLIQSTN